MLTCMAEPGCALSRHWEDMLLELGYHVTVVIPLEPGLVTYRTNRQWLKATAYHCLLYDNGSICTHTYVYT
jgi:hypothetical protein